MSGVIKLRALECLASHIERLCPELEGKICAGPADHPHKLEWPHLVLIPVSYEFFPDQDGDIWGEVGDTKAVFRVGRHECLVQLRLGARTSRQRFRLEHGLSQVFVSSRGRPGVLTLQISDCYNALIAYEFDSTEWEDEMAFDKAFASISTVTMQVPALVERGAMYTIEDLRLSFAEDLTTAFANLPASAIETIQIEEDGDVVPSSLTP